MADFTPTQGRYLAFIHAYIKLRGFPPAESEIAAAMCVSPPSVNQMVKALEKKGLILRQPGRARSLKILVPEEEIPGWNQRTSSRGGVDAESPAGKATKSKATKPKAAPGQGTWVMAAKAAPAANLYVLMVYLVGGPTGPKFANKEISRVIEIRGDQTLEQLHNAIFEAYDRWEQHLYQFQCGKGPFDPKGPNYGIPDGDGSEGPLDARVMTLDDLALKQYRTFGYWFDFGDDWYHQVQVERIEPAIPTVTYPRVIKRVGKSPPQHADE